MRIELVSDRQLAKVRIAWQGRMPLLSHVHLTHWNLTKRSHSGPGKAAWSIVFLIRSDSMRVLFGKSCFRLLPESSHWGEVYNKTIQGGINIRFLLWEAYNGIVPIKYCLIKLTMVQNRA